MERRMSEYHEALNRQAEILDSQLAQVRNRQQSRTLTDAEAASERCRLLELHLTTLRALRRAHLEE
jgi:hypothetical protein